MKPTEAWFMVESKTERAGRPHAVVTADLRLMERPRTGDGPGLVLTGSLELSGTAEEMKPYAVGSMVKLTIEEPES